VLVRIFRLVLSACLFLLQLVWGGPIIIGALLFTAFMSLVVIAANRWRDKATAQALALVWIWVIRHGFMRLMLMRVPVDTADFVPPLCRRVIVLVPHPSWSGVMAMFYVAWFWLPRPGPVVMKRELLHWIGGRAMEAVGLGWSIDRGNRRQALDHIQRQGGELAIGSALVLPEGHRPTRDRILASQRKLGLNGAARLAGCFQHTTHPRAGAVLQLLQAWPDAAVVRLDICSAIHEEQMLGAVRMVGRAYYTRLVNVPREALVNPSLPEAEQEAFLAERLTEMWASQVNPWMSVCRGLPVTPVPRPAGHAPCEDPESRIA
jgi:hypothetical protein